MPGKHLRLIKQLATIVIGMGGMCAVVVILNDRGERSPSVDLPTDTPPSEPHYTGEPRYTGQGLITNWWDEVPDFVRDKALDRHVPSNIHPADYTGPQACRECHQKNYEGWSRHPHRWMNALATESTIRGDFSGAAGISYLKGEATFFRQGDDYLMRLERDGQSRVYQITQTIGSRFFQYYVGHLIEGPEPAGHPWYKSDHVLPFGYWLDEQEWVPIVHVGGEPPDGYRADPFGPVVASPTPHEDYFPYAESCNRCHTTFPLADMIVREPELIGRHVPVPMSFFSSAYLARTHPEVWDGTRPARDVSSSEVNAIIDAAKSFDAREHAVTLGISCEACHLGSRAHAERKLKRPEFIPGSPYLFVEAAPDEVEFGRVHANVNWVCGRCHSGHRPEFAAGMGTWNSTEFGDAMQGSCYSELRCVDCHNPHQPTGRAWSQTPAQDDKSCLRCHDHYAPAEALAEHTHHPPESEGSRCMNCHMPRINEGLQDVVRTHTIFSPTHRGMIEANHPNACNLCHPDRSILWTVEHLNDWYGTEFSQESLAQIGSDPARSAGLGWLASDDPSVRLVAADALARTDSTWALPELLKALDDPYLLNRQFAQRGLEKMLGIELLEDGYRFYMTPQERRDPIERLRERLIADPGE